MTLRVLTLNLWNTAGDWRSRRVAVEAVVRSREPDVICLQEVVHDARGNQAEWLAERLGGWAVAYAGEPPGSPTGEFGNAILSRWPIDATTTHRLPYVDDPLDIQRLVLHGRTGGVDVFCTHLSWQLDDGALRERQVRSLMAFVREQTDPDATVGPVVAGDFNAEPDSTEMRYLTGLQSLDGERVYLQDAWRLAGDGGPGITWSNRNPHAAVDREPDRRIDYVLSGFHGRAGGGRPVECEVVADEPVDGVWPSDHFGVFAALEV